ncbi:MAG: type II secretion system F family protein [Proteobacteria bacterium]|nr:type II secretion system F family protein [Pseudomonadota bacterium]
MSIFASPFWLYLSHLLTWGSLAAVGFVFKERIYCVFDMVFEQRSISTSDREQDQFIAIASGITLFSIVLLIDLNIFVAISGGSVAFVMTPIIIRRRRFALFQKTFDASLVESLTTVSSSLRAGLTLKDSLVVAVQNCPPIFSREISRVLKDYRFGISIDGALDGVRKRVQTQNTNIAFGALIIGTQLGGKVPDVLNRIVTTIREVDRVEGRLKALTAQGKAQGVLLCSMPILIAIGLYIMDREKIEFMMTSPLGKILIGIAVFLEIVGILVTAKVMRLDV